MDGCHSCYVSFFGRQRLNPCPRADIFNDPTARMHLHAPIVQRYVFQNFRARCSKKPHRHSFDVPGRRLFATVMSCVSDDIRRVPRRCVLRKSNGRRDHQRQLFNRHQSLPRTSMKSPPESANMLAGRCGRNSAENAMTRMGLSAPRPTTAS